MTRPDRGIADTPIPLRKFLNHPQRFADETLEGLLLAHPTEVRRLDHEPRTVVRADRPATGHVVIATGGGSGHLPLFVGYVVRGPHRAYDCNRLVNITYA
jgi:dihydroxyacetone kinase